MKKLIFTLFVAFMATVALRAQQIAVVNTNGATKLFRTFPDAINGADPGSVIYLPGGGFTISNDLKITKKLTIIGIGHYVKSENPNVDGNTTIGGNLFFNEGSDGSAVMGCYITGNVNIGHDGKGISDVLIRFCNLNALHVGNKNCMETIVNQNYIRECSNFGASNAVVTNNVMHSIYDLDDGKIANNVILHRTGLLPNGGGYPSNPSPFKACERDQIMNNIFREANVRWECDASNALSGNLAIQTDVVEYNLGEVDWNDVFENYNNATVSPESSFHFKGDYKQYETKCGIYGGTSFKDEQMAPVPYITFKDVPQETDAQGKLNVRIRVSANK